jgi:hypothetical protein
VTGVSIPETVLIFVGAPVAIYAVIALAALGPSQLRAPARYRPGRPWPHQPAWFVPHSPPADGAVAPAGHEISGHHVPELTATDPAKPAAVGGASGEW